MLLSIENNLTKIQGIQQTYVATAGTAGQAAWSVKNIDGLNANWGLQIGQTGEETAEIMLISGAPSGTVVNFGTSPSHTGGTSLFAHAQDSPMYQVHYDQIIINRSTAGTGGPFSALATVSIQPDNQFTSYDDTTGATGYAYYVQYYNSVNSDTSGSSSIFIPGGPTFYSLQKLTQRLKDKLYSAGYVNMDSKITDWLNEGIELMSNAAIKVNETYMAGTTSLAIGTSGLGTVTNTDFKRPLKVEVSYDGGVTYIPSARIKAWQYSTLDVFTSLAPRHAWLGETVFEVMPHPGNTNGLVKLLYAQRFTPLVNDSDEVTQTLKAYTTALVEYGLSVAYGLDQKDTQQQEHFQKFMKDQQDFVMEITPRDDSGPSTIDIVEGLTGMQEDTIYAGEVIL